MLAPPRPCALHETMATCGEMDANADSSPLSGMLFLLGMAVVGLVQMILLSVSGQTVGKKIMRIRIVKLLDGSNPGFLGAVLAPAKRRSNSPSSTRLWVNVAWLAPC